MQIEISSICNRSCKQCYRKDTSRELGHMQLDLFKEVVDKLTLSSFPRSIFLAGFGESTLNKDFWNMVRYAKIRDFNLILPTNGTTLDEDTIKKMRMIDQVQLSVDSLLINNELRDGVNDVLNYIPLFKKYRINVQLNVTLGSANINEVPRFLHYGIKESIPIYFMCTTPLNVNNAYLCEEFKYCIDKLNEVNHYISQYHCNAAMDIGCTTFNNCRYINKDLAVASNGDIFPCNDAILKGHSFGNIADYGTFDFVKESDSVRRVWQGSHPICDFCKSLDSYRTKYYTPTQVYDKRIDNFKNKHIQDKCFVLCNGPSLTEDVINLLRDKITIGVNQIYFAKDLWDFEPTYYNFADSHAVIDDEYFERIKAVNSIKFYSEQIYYQSALGAERKYITTKKYEDLKDMISVNWINPSINVKSLSMPNPKLISFDLHRGTLESGTVVQALSIPLAAWMGSKRIYLVGCDCTSDGHFYKKESNAWKVGPDVIKQYGWLQNRLGDIGSIMYNASPSALPNIDNVSIEEAVADD